MQTVNQFMGADHDRLDDIFRRFQDVRKKDLSGAMDLFRAFRSGLLRHIRWEEDLLFPSFEKETGMALSGPTQVMRMEHREIKLDLEKIGADLLNGNSGQWETPLLDVLSDHNNKEEAVLYPWIDRSLTAEEVESLVLLMKADVPKSA